MLSYSSLEAFTKKHYIYIIAGVLLLILIIYFYKRKKMGKYTDEIFFKNYIKSNQAEFIEKVKKIAKNIGVLPNDLMTIMYKESSLNHQTRGSIAVGLIQFLEGTARDLGTTQQALLNMTNVQQLDYVEKYYLNWMRILKKKFSNYTDLYLVTFQPSAFGKPDSHVIMRKGTEAYRLNAGVDFNKDGLITVGDFRRYALQRIPKQYLPYLA